MIWGVFLALLAVLALLGRTRLGVRGEYTPRSVGLWLRVGGLRWQLYPRKERTKKRTAEPAAKPAKAKGEEKGAAALSPELLFRLARRLLPVALEGAGQLRRRLQVDALRLEILVGAPDPSETAERYGQVSALLGSVWQPAVEALHIQDGRVRVLADFTRTAPALYGSASLSLTAGQLLWLGLRYGPKCLKILLEVRKQEKAAGTRQRKAA